MGIGGAIEAFGIVAQWVMLYISGRVMNLFKLSMFAISKHWTSPSIILSRAIFLHFLFGTLDGTYWQGAWIAKYIHHPWEGFLFENGIAANIPFRHIGPIIVGYLHLYARAIEKNDIFPKADQMAIYNKEIFLVSLLAIAHTLYITKF